MSSTRTEIRRGRYADSVVLMQLQSDLAKLDGVHQAAVLMGTAANLELLESSRLLSESARSAGADDLVIVVAADSDQQAQDALDRVDTLLARSSDEEIEDYRPKSLRTAIRSAAEANWILISVPGKWAAEVAHEAIDHRLNVFLYSDNVPLEEEVSLKSRAAEIGSLVLGPDCGTAIVGGVGLGFANRIRRGPVGVVAASGTGLQAVTSRVHQLGSGVSHALGTGGRDLNASVGGRTAGQALQLLADDPATEVLVLTSKPPAPEVASTLLAAALGIDKPVVVQFADYPPPAPRVGNLVFTRGLSEAADVAADLAGGRTHAAGLDPRRRGGGVLRGLFAGGTLALEACQGLRPFLSPLLSNLKPGESEAGTKWRDRSSHVILDLGADEYTVGRLHPMIDPSLRLELLAQLIDPDREGVILLDVVLGSGAHPDPASELTSIIESVRQRSEQEVVVVVVGTDEDPQDLESTRSRLEAAGARVTSSVSEALELVVRRLSRPAGRPTVSATSLEVRRPINVGLESFYQELREQQLSAVQMDWRPPAGGDEELHSILRRMRA